MERERVVEDEKTHGNKPHFTFTSTEKRLNEVASYVVHFIIDVEYKGTKKRVEARYSDLLAINKKLREAFRGDRHAKFPSRFGTITVFGSDEAKIERRRKELELYFNSLKEEYFEYADVRDFFKLNSAATVAEERTVSFRININRPIPEMITLAGEVEFFPNAVITSIVENINALEDMRLILQKTPNPMERVALVESMREKRDSIVVSLGEFQDTVMALTYDEAMSRYPEVLEALNLVDSYIGIACSWAAHVAEHVAAAAAKVENTTNPIGKRLESYKREGEDIVTDFLTKPKSETQDTYKRLAALFSNVERDIKIYESRGDAVVVSRLVRIKEYVRESTQAIRQKSNEFDSITSIAEFEKRMFGLLGEIHEREEGEHDVDAQTKLKNKLHALIRDIRKVKRQLLDEDEKGNKAVIARLEDLQENLSELVYTFNNKFETKKNLEEKAQATIIKHQVNNAQRSNIRVATDLYGL